MDGNDQRFPADDSAVKTVDIHGCYAKDDICGALRMREKTINSAKVGKRDPNQRFKYLEYNQTFYLYKIDFACADVVVKQPIKRSIVPVTVSRAHGRTWLELTQEGPVLANTTKKAKLE